MRFTLVQSIFASVIISLFTQAACAAAEPDIPMNVLLLIVDDLNTWLLEDPTRYSGKVVAPNIQRLAKEGVLFHNAYTASPVCSPSRTAFLSGVAPWKSGVSRNGVQVGDSKVLQGVPSLFRTFQDQGYWIGSFGKVSHGYDTGVKYDASMSHKRTPPPPRAPLNGIAQSAGGKLTERDWGATHLDENEMSDKRLADAAIEALRHEHDKPFFIACGLFHPHYPWYVPQKYLDMYPLDEIELPPIKDGDMNDVPDYGQRLVDLGWDGKVKDKGLVKEAIRGYLASVTFSDAHMGRVLKTLDESPHRDNTIVILISDHGLHLGEKQHWSKGTLWEEATDSVMMWRVPGVTQAKQICTRPVSLLDIYPTLVDLNGIEKPNHLDGHSLLPLLKDAAAPRSQPAITVYDGHMSVRTETARFIRYWDGTTELYDRTKDPHEWTNQTNNPQFAAMKTKLAGLLPPKEEGVEPLPSRQAGALNSTPRKPKRDRTKAKSLRSP
ncbi:Choline-sulfatase [Pirellulimonas nuda]|uniref:Choline-sulfatase n=1 Tax=Pirellulimonas nuda TaxID=2528009 RepID=A0A518DCC7_9BACT|nr:Choline-sulfatase [Pirellulimonas nuda]